MAENSKIEWCHHTVNFWIGCTKVSPACDHCYAERDWSKTGRYKRVEWGAHGARSPTKDPMATLQRIAAGAARRGQRERVFINSLSDWADNHKSILPEWRAAIFAAARQFPNLDFLLLTKRPQNIGQYLPADWGDGYPNVWLGTTVENQKEADRRIRHLLETPAAIRFVSIEPLLDAVRLDRIEEGCDDFSDCGGHPDPHWPSDTSDWMWLDALSGVMRAEARDPSGARLGDIDVGLEHIGGKIDWVIVGGESGPSARPMHPHWARSIRDQCAAAGVPFFFKQWGEYREVFTPEPELIDNETDRADELYASAVNPSFIQRDGTHILSRDDLPFDEDNAARLIERIGKARAGRLLDGIGHNGMPKVLP